MRTQKLTRYLQPLREGGSLPALAEADDDFLYVVKFRGAGHGVRALVAELIGGEVARALGLNVPELVFLEVDDAFGQAEADEEIQDLLKASRGLNLGLHFLSGAFSMDPYVNKADSLTASLIVWLDSYLTNVDRTARNTNLLQWHQKETWVIDHGASLIFHHSWSDPHEAAVKPFSFVRNHTLLTKASQLDEADRIAHERLTPDIIRDIVNLLPDEWLNAMELELPPDRIRQVYYSFLTERLAGSRIFTEEAIKARHESI